MRKGSPQTKNRAGPLGLTAAAARMEAELLKHRTMDGHFDRAEVRAAVKAKWAIMENERARGHHFLTWGTRVSDFTSPCTFLIFDIGPSIVSVWIGAAAISGAEARAMAFDNLHGPVEQMLENIKEAPRGWISGLQIKRSEFRLSRGKAQGAK